MSTKRQNRRAVVAALAIVILAPLTFFASLGVEEFIRDNNEREQQERLAAFDDSPIGPFFADELKRNLTPEVESYCHEHYSNSVMLVDEFGVQVSERWVCVESLLSFDRERCRSGVEGVDLLCGEVLGHAGQDLCVWARRTADGTTQSPSIEMHRYCGGES